MCLKICSNVNFIKRLKKAGKEGLIVYKIYSVFKYGKYITSFFKGNIINKPGWVFSDRKNKTFTKYEQLHSNIENGIHVYLDKNEAEVVNKMMEESVTPVRVFYKDFIAVGCWDEDKDIKSAVFNKIYISKKTWDNLFIENKE